MAKPRYYRKFMQKLTGDPCRTRGPASEQGMRDGPSEIATIPRDGVRKGSKFEANKDVKEAKEVNDEKFSYSNRINTRNGGHIA